ncbi:MAG: dihydrodipicolinate synthase family protein [Pirellulaceae bacterium]|nr:dihydrodipicolinate synthase family protein [Pirellulaceae bacterium]
MICHGIVPPLATPLTTYESLDIAGLERLVAHQLQGDVNGLFILGTTGEAPSLSGRVQRELIQRTAQLMSGSDRPLLVGITHSSMSEAVDLGRFAAEHGATAAVAAAPFYFAIHQAELLQWFRQLADELPLPLMLYNMPSCVRIDIADDTLLALTQHRNIVGLKDSSGDLQYFQQAVAMAQAQRPDWPVMIGPEALLAQAIDLGAAGGVTGGANLCPRLFVDMYRAASSGQVQERTRLQVVIDELQMLYEQGAYGSAYLPGLKYALQLAGLCSGKLAPPWRDLPQQSQLAVREWLDNFKRHGYLP